MDQYISMSIDNDPWTFNDVITVYNWEKHPEWNKYPFDPKNYEHYMKTPSSVYMTECKILLNNYGCIEWDSQLQKNYFKSNEKWEKNKFFPVELSDDARNLYKIDFPWKLPIVTHCVNVPNNLDSIQINGTWKIYYYGGSDAGYLFVNTIEKFREDANYIANSELKNYLMLYFPAVTINNPFVFATEKEKKNKDGIGIIYDNVSTFKVQISNNGDKIPSIEI